MTVSIRKGGVSHVLATTTKQIIRSFLVTSMCSFIYSYTHFLQGFYTFIYLPPNCTQYTTRTVIILKARNRRAIQWIQNYITRWYHYMVEINLNIISCYIYMIVLLVYTDILCLADIQNYQIFACHIYASNGVIGYVTNSLSISSIPRKNKLHIFFVICQWGYVA